MADSNFRGPVTSMGSLEGQQGTGASVENFDGPSIWYQGGVLPDLRMFPFAKDGTQPGRVLGVLQRMDIVGCDHIPQKSATTTLAASQVGTAALAVSLATVGAAGVASAANIAVGVPIIPVGTSVATNVIALDFGFTTGSTVVNSSTVYVQDSTLFRQGQWIIIGNVGNSTLTRSLITQVVAIGTSNLTTVNVSPLPQTTLVNVPIGQANLHGWGLLPPGSQFGPPAPAATAHEFGGAITAGLAKVANPRECLARNIIVALATSGNYSCVVQGWDVWGNPMAEVISLASQTTAAGKRAFKYIGSITSGTSQTDPVSFGIGDTFGYPFRVDEWEQTTVIWNLGIANTNNGFTAAAIGTATSTSGDVRGTIQISTTVVTGVIGTAISSFASNGTGRLMMAQFLGAWNQVYANPNNTAPVFGWPQSTATT